MAQPDLVRAVVRNLLHSDVLRLAATSPRMACVTDRASLCADLRALMEHERDVLAHLLEQD